MNYKMGLAAFALASLTASAHAADPVPDNLTWHGVTVYGAAGLDYAYRTHSGYWFNRHFNVYSGIGYSEAGGGLSSGYLNNNMTTFATGMRLKF